MRLTAYFKAYVVGTLTAAAFLAGGGAFAGDATQDQPACSCPDAEGKAARPKFAELSSSLRDENDEIAALESVQLALSRVEDGTPFVWRRDNGRLSGVVRPTASFRSAAGSICRHVVILLTTGIKTRSSEGIACRLANGRWQLEG